MASAPVVKVICVGTGRDGTSSIASMFQSAFDQVGAKKRAMHEYQAREFYDAFCNYRETGDRAYLNDIHRWIEVCPYDCIVGNGYAPVLSLFAEHWGSNAALVHIRRMDTAGCVESLKKNCTLFPMAYRYYSTSAEVLTKRMAAFHFAEMSEDQWNELSIEEKFYWYYGKTHALICSHKTDFARYCEIRTEEICNEETLRKVAELATGDSGLQLAPKWLNAHQVDITKVPPDRRDKVQWLFRRMDLNQIANDDGYAIDYFLSSFVAWSEYQIDGSVGERSRSRNDRKTPKEIEAILASALDMLYHRVGKIESLKQSVADVSEKERASDHH